MCAELAWQNVDNRVVITRSTVGHLESLRVAKALPKEMDDARRWLKV